MQTKPSKDYHARIFTGGQDKAGVLTHQKFRKHLFVDSLGWRLDHRDGLEFDEFDRDDATYCLLYFRQKAVGGWRAMPTTAEYLSHKVFPQLATHRPYPSDPDIWEISRLGVLPIKAGLVPARLVYALMIYFAASRGARSLVGVVDDTHARNMAVAGMKLRGFGESQRLGTSSSGDTITGFFAELFLEEQSGPRFERLVRFIDWLEIDDEALLLGRKSISA